MQVGKWLELRGIDVGKPVFRAPPGHHVEVSKDSMVKAPPEKTYASGAQGWLVGSPAGPAACLGPAGRLWLVFVPGLQAAGACALAGC